MVDVLTKEQRSLNMSRIRGRDTKPELIVRRMLHAAGFRYRLHRKDLPGKPDLVFPGRKKIVFVHGCFWHCHHCRAGQVRPSDNASFWQAKREGNVQRDLRNLAALEERGWDPLVVWECETKDRPALLTKLMAFLKPAETQ